MLINLKVKTLDSQTHDFEVDNEITVREFKDKIAERTNISADQQRIIYCGRVLADEKNLKEYDVDGKVVHVAERPPPSQLGPSTSSTSNDDGGNTRDRASGRNMRNSPLFRALDGMVVGTMAIPMNPGMNNTAGPVNPFTSSSSFCMNRITVARHMLDCVNNIAAYLEDPERGLNNTSLDILARGRWTMESTVVELGVTADLPTTQNIVDMVQGAVSAALRRNGNTNVTVVQLPTVFGSNEDGMNGAADGSIVIDESLDDANMETSTNSSTNNASHVVIEDVGAEEDEASMNAGSSNSSTSAVSGAATAASATGNSTSTGTNTDDNNSPRRTGTTVLAEVIDQMRTVQSRLNPFIEQFYDLLQNEPQFEENDTTGRENAQRLYDRVSEAFHYMSHAQHAISDLMLDVSQPTPRFLTCRPILVEQSGFISNNYLSSAAAAAAAANSMRTPPTVPLNAMLSRSTNTDGNAGNSGTASAPSARNNVTNTGTRNEVEDPVDDPVVAPNASRSANSINVGTQSNDHSAQMSRLFEAVVNAAPIDTEFHVQINAPSIVSLGMPTNMNAAAMNAAARLRAQLEAFRNGDAPAGTNGTTGTANNASTSNENSNSTDENASSANNTNSSANATSNNPDQARVTTATLPTTSTQTRSTSRPQLQMGNGWNGRFVPTNVVSSFDRFLPCNSHHIREPDNGGNNGGTAGTSAAQAHPHIHNTGATDTPNNRNMRLLSNLNRRFRRPMRRLAVGSTMTQSTPNSNRWSPQPTARIRMPNSTELLRSLFTPVPVQPRSASIPAVRTQLIAFINERLFEGRPINSENIPNAVNRAVNWLRDVTIYLPQYEKPEFDGRESVLNLLRHTLRQVIEVIQSTTDTTVQFEDRLNNILDVFVERLFNVLYNCLGSDNVDLYWAQLMRLLMSAIRTNLPSQLATFLNRFLHIDNDFNNDYNVDEFLVRRVITQTILDTNAPIEMDIEMNDAIPATSSAVQASSECQAATTSIKEPIDAAKDVEMAAPPILPNVVPGSETWHRDFPNDWLPIIARDIRSQEQSAEGEEPYSDAYIAGMSAKRRKLVQSSKPSDMRSLLEDSVRKAMETVGVTSATAPTTVAVGDNVNETEPSQISCDEIVTVIANDSEVQSSCSDVVRTNLRERLKKDPEYTAEKYPQVTKFINN